VVLEAPAASIVRPPSLHLHAHNLPGLTPAPLFPSQVATSDVVTGPIRLLFPRVPGSIGEAAEFPFSLLGGWGGWPSVLGVGGLDVQVGLGLGKVLRGLGCLGMGTEACAGCPPIAMYGWTLPLQLLIGLFAAVPTMAALPDHALVPACRPG